MCLRLFLFFSALDSTGHFSAPLPRAKDEQDQWTKGEVWEVPQGDAFCAAPEPHGSVRHIPGAADAAAKARNDVRDDVPPAPHIEEADIDAEAALWLPQ